MPVPNPRHEPAPALQALMLDYLNSTPWAADGNPQMLFVYTDRISNVKIPPFAYVDHPRIMIKRMADIFEESRRSGQLMAKPADMVGAGMLLETWDIAFDSKEERDYWRTRDFSGHPRALETRMLLVHQPGHPAVVALHSRDRRATGREIRFPVPTICDEPLLPGGSAPPLLVHLERLCRALLQAPATFLSGPPPQGPQFTR